MTVFPDPDELKGVDPATEVVPNTFKIFAAGTAVPESVIKDVGTFGGVGPPPDTLVVPDWDI